MHLASLRPHRAAVASVALLIAIAPVSTAQQPAASGPSRQMQPADLKSWKNIRQQVLSNDGRWFAYVLAPNEGDATVIIRSTGADGKEMKFPIGEAGGVGGGRGGPPGAGGPASTLSVSGDSRWVAFTVYPPAATGRGGRGGRGGGGGGGGAPTGAPGAATTPPAQNKMALVNLATG